MQTFELNIFIDCAQARVYDHLSEPINLIGLWPLLTEIDVLKEQKDEDGVVLRSYQMVETFKWLGLPIFRNRIFGVIHLTKPKEAMEIRIYGRPKTEIIFEYKFRQFNDQRTQITLTVQFVKVNRLMENTVVNRAKHIQRVLLSNLKVRLERQ